MTEGNDEKKVRNRFPDRFTVDPSNLEKVGRLLDQLRSGVRGSDATRKEILNWIIEKFPEELSPSDLKELSERFYDEERFLRIALEEVRAAKARGERRTIEDILQKKTTGAAPVRRGPRKRKVDVPSEDTEPATDEIDRPSEQG